MLADDLKSLGLGKNEASVYVSLQELGKSGAGKLIEITGFHRNIVYQSLKALEEKGLLTKIEGSGATLFQANNPSELLHLVKRQEFTARQIVRELESRAKIMKQKVSLFEGNTGFHSAFWDMIETLEPGQELLIMGIFDIDEEFQGMIKTFHEERAAVGIPARILMNAHATQVGDMLSRIDATSVRYMQPGLVTPSVFFIYAGKTMISLPNQRMFIRIENEEATKAFRSYFNTLWDRTTQTFKGETGIASFMDFVLEVGEPVQLIGAHFQFREIYPEMWEGWHKRRVQKKIAFQAVVSQGTSMTGVQDLELAEIRVVPTQIFPSVTWTFGEYVANIVWIDREETVAFVIKHEAIARQQREYFNLLWKSGEDQVVSR